MSGGRTLPGSRWLLVAGVVLLVAGLQALLFERLVAAASDGTSQALTNLERESADNASMNEALRKLQLAYRATGDEPARRAILALRDAVIERYPENRREAVDALYAGAAQLAAPEPEGDATIQALRHEAGKLAELYEARTQTALELYTNPPWYLWPTAALVNGDDAVRYALRFNHALYLGHSGDPATALSLLEELRVAASGDDRRTAEVDFALARLNFATWTTEPDPALFDALLERATSSVRHDANYPPARLFLEYLLSLDRSAAKVELEPEEGQGDGEGRGERGVIATERRDF